MSKNIAMPFLNAERYFKQASDNVRNAFQKDRDRIIHSSAFRRLQYKTQVFIYNEGDHYRTRLTHSLEVAQIARSIGVQLHGNIDLIEALALVHDIGHPAFAHSGEKSLQKCMQNYGGFDHNAQSFLIVTEYENRYPDFNGLNLTYTCLEGMLKHNTLDDIQKAEFKNLISHSIYHDVLDFDSFPCLESQIASISDDIAYCSHDLDDAIRANLLSLESISEIDFLCDIIKSVLSDYPTISQQRLRHEFIRRLVHSLISDVIQASQEIMRKHGIDSYQQVQNAPFLSVKFSEAMHKNVYDIKAFLYDNMYQSKPVLDVMQKAQNIIEDLFSVYFHNPDKLPSQWHNIEIMDNEQHKARHICNFIAGMTDRFAIEQHKKHCIVL